MALNVCSLNSAIGYYSFIYGKYQLRFFDIDITVKDENVTSINNKAANLNAPCEESVLESRM